MTGLIFIDADAIIFGGIAKNKKRGIMTDKEKKQVQEFKSEVEKDIKKGNLHWETFAAFVILTIIIACIGFGAWWYLGNIDISEEINSKLNYKKAATSSATTNTVATKDEYAGWKTYTNTVFKFLLKYPGTWVLTDKLPASTAIQGTAQSALNIANGSKYSVNLWINPDGFGMEGKKAYVNYENSTVVNKKLTLGTRKYSETTAADEEIMGPGEGFLISSSFTYLGNRYILSLGGSNVNDLTEAENFYKGIVNTLIWNN